MNEETQTTQATQTTAAAETPQPTEEQVSAAIDTALDEAVAEVGGGEGGEKAKVEGQGQGQGQGQGEGEQRNDALPGPDATQEPQVAPKEDLSAEQALMERGIRAGLSMADLVAIPTHGAAEKIISMAEKAAGILPDKGKEDDGAGTPADDLGAAIEEMKNDGEYDPKILGLLEGLYKENQKLKVAGETATQGTVFDRQFGSLDEGVRSHVDAARKSQLRSKYDMLRAGYRAQGLEVAPEQVFQEAAQLAIGDLMGRAAEERKAVALAQRKNLTLARPGGENGYTPRRTGPATEEDIASEIWDQINQ